MVTDYPSPGRARGNPPILSRDGNAIEHLLVVVDHPAGMVSISDDVMVRVLSPGAATELVMQILHALGGRLVPPAGPLSAGF